MDNQQAIGKIAGLYLGEGHFVVSKYQRANGKWQFSAEIGFSNTDAELIHFVCDWLDAIGARFHMDQNSQGCWQVKVSRFESVLKMLDRMEPHLIGQKKAEAALLRRFVERRTALGNEKRGCLNPPYEEEDHAIVDAKRLLSASPQRLMSTAREPLTA